MNSVHREETPVRQRWSDVLSPAYGSVMVIAFSAGYCTASHASLRTRSLLSRSRTQQYKHKDLLYTRPLHPDHLV